MKGSGRTTLGDCCEIVMGQAPEGSAYGPLGRGWPLIAGAGDFGDGVPAPKKSTSIAPKLSRPGDIILAVRASIGEIVLSDGIYCLGRGVAALRAAEGLDSAYLRHWVTHARPLLESKARGATFKQVDRTAIAELELELPRVPEQRRIAEILDQAEALRAKRRAALAQVDGLTQEIFLEMFGDPATNPRGWLIRRVGDVSDVQGGLQVSASRRIAEREVPYLRVANVFRSRLDLSEIKSIRASAAEIARTRLLRDDLLLVEGHGNPEEIGRCALWDGSILECVHQNHLIRARFAAPIVEPRFACEYINSPGGRRHLLRSGKTTSGLNTISVSEVRAVPIAIPPLDLQHQFASRTAAVDKLKASHRASLAQLDALFASLQHRAFRGEL